MYANYQDLLAIRFMPGTKVSHDYSGNEVKTFSYKELIGIKVPAIGIPCRQNNLIVIDVDVESDQHKHDGREWWVNFCRENNIPKTYTVQTASGGYHFYFSLPQGINPDTFRPPANLAPGVDVKYNGWVGAPPTAGYTVLNGNISTIEEVPPSLFAYMATAKDQPATFDNPESGISFTAHRPYTEEQISEIRIKIKWLQENGDLSRSEWRDGLFALKAGVTDPDVLEELAVQWTMNKAYQQGDEQEALSIVNKADRFGPIGPGTIFSIIKAVQIREGAAKVDSSYTFEQILNRANVPYSFGKDGKLKISNSETNCARLIGAMFDESELYHDVRSDQYIYKGRPYNDVEITNVIMPKIQSSEGGLGLDKFRKNIIKSGLEVLLSERQIDPHKKYLDSLKWDGQSRIENFFSHYCGVSDNEYHRKVSKNFWVSLAARGLKPGIKFDSMVIIEGVEGIRKSSLVEAIGGEYTFAPSRKDALENMDELRKMHQSVIVELPELMGLVNQPAERVKAFLASPFDHIRDLYARKAMRKERGFVFVGTTNSSEYLQLDMGLRRFWPISIPRGNQIDIDGIKRDRDQLFAEAIQHYRDGHPFFTIDQEVLNQYASNKIITDPIDYVIEEMIGDDPNVNLVTVYRNLEAAGYISRGLNQQSKTRISNSLRRLNYKPVGNSESFVKSSISKEFSAARQYDFSSII